METTTSKPAARAMTQASPHESYLEVLDRARQLVPRLRERTKRAEKARQLLPETIDDLLSAGILRIMQPRRWGGMEFDLVAYFDFPYELARGCASTSWTVVNLLIHNWMLALYDERAQEDIWASNHDVLIASGVVFAQGQARKVDGGFVISGRWNFSSGVSVSEWNMLATIVRDGGTVIDHRLCLVHKSDYEIVDDWYVMGMRSTGSMTVVAKDVFVPEHRALCMYTARGGNTFPGAATNPSPAFQVALPAFSGHGLAAVSVGNAQAALELTIESVKERSTSFTAAKMRDIQAVQMRVGSAASRIDAAYQLLRKECVELQEFANRGEVPSAEIKLRCKRNCAYAVSLCTEAVDMLHALAGANGIYETYPIETIFRDAHALAGHFSFATDVHYSTWGLVALGGDFANPLL